MNCSENRTGETESQAEAIGGKAVCLHCGKPLSFWQRRNGSRFCSTRHEELKRQTRVRLMGTLLESQRKSIRGIHSAARTLQLELPPATFVSKIAYKPSWLRRQVPYDATLPSPSQAGLQRWPIPIDILESLEIQGLAPRVRTECAPLATDAHALIVPVLAMKASLLRSNELPWPAAGAQGNTRPVSAGELARSLRCEYPRGPRPASGIDGIESATFIDVEMAARIPAASVKFENVPAAWGHSHRAASGLPRLTAGRSFGLATSQPGRWPEPQAAVRASAQVSDPVAWDLRAARIAKMRYAGLAVLKLSAFAAAAGKIFAQSDTVRSESIEWNTTTPATLVERPKCKRRATMAGGTFAGMKNEACASAEAVQSESIGWNTAAAALLPARIDAGRGVILNGTAFASVNNQTCKPAPATQSAPGTVEWQASIVTTLPGFGEIRRAALQAPVLAKVTQACAPPAASQSGPQRVEWKVAPSAEPALGKPIWENSTVATLPDPALAKPADWKASASARLIRLFGGLRAATLQPSDSARLRKWIHGPGPAAEAAPVDWNQPASNVQFTCDGVLHGSLATATFENLNHQACEPAPMPPSEPVNWSVQASTMLLVCGGVPSVELQTSAFASVACKVCALGTATQSELFDWNTPAATALPGGSKFIQFATLRTSGFANVASKACEPAMAAQSETIDWNTQAATEMPARVEGRRPAALTTPVFANVAAQTAELAAVVAIESSPFRNAPAALTPAPVGRVTVVLRCSAYASAAPMAVSPSQRQTEAAACDWSSLPQAVLPSRPVHFPELRQTGFESEQAAAVDTVCIAEDSGWQTLAAVEPSMHVRLPWNERSESAHPAELRAVLALLTSLNIMDEAPAGDWKSLLAARPSVRSHGSLVKGMAFERHFAFPRAAAGTGTLLLSAMSLRDAGRFEDAAKLYLEARADDYYLFEARLGLAVCRLHLDKPRQARHLFELCLEERPGSIEAMFGIAMAFDLARQTAEAVAAYGRVLESDPRCVEALENLAGLALEQGNPALAREHAGRLAAMGLATAESLRVVAYCDLIEGEFDAAAQSFSSLTSATRGGFDGWFNLAVAQHRLGRLEAAAEAYNYALTLRADFDRAWLNLGLVRHESGDLEGAREAYGRVPREARGTASAANLAENARKRPVWIERVA